MASKRRNWLMRQARKNQRRPVTGKNGGFPCYWHHDSKDGNRSALDMARGRYDYGYTLKYAYRKIIGFVNN